MIDVQIERDTAQEASATFLEHMVGVANVDTVFGLPIEQGTTTIVPCCEVMIGGGMGTGGGSGEASEAKSLQIGWGAGSGGSSRARPVALIVMSPKGVAVKPIVDVTRVSLVALTTIAVVFSWLRRFSPQKPTTRRISAVRLDKAQLRQLPRLNKAQLRRLSRLNKRQFRQLVSSVKSTASVAAKQGKKFVR